VPYTVPAKGFFCFVFYQFLRQEAETSFTLANGKENLSYVVEKFRSIKKISE
jgi:hypothetical protein